ncbi:HAD-IA family hydrolase [Enterobacteriaceae bacterium H20N1]|uniref:HAD-IA family hydrolase n=1 Tax=Dryocola boscaweniae TaxID=2925397 RepID=A0A9X2W775_9ENTR|nr:HAD-IA family hydrolase [Dryocola boscaweniae]MCT4702398.1 HAD-IA family hydrolase [Dryocola boscaweniae]MCT4719566.1 HAD-IA family hydrolase [Dryocola boscaweniae]
MSVQAVIFDMDGVIIDSEGFWQDSQIEVLAGFGIAITAQECEKYTKGKRIDEIARVWCERYSLAVQPLRLEEHIVSQVCQSIRTEGRAMSGLYQALRCFQANGYRMALATSSSQQIIAAVFDKLALWEWFEVVCSADDERFGKPHPAVYLTALFKLGLNAGECVVIEDSLNGFIAASRAQIKTFVVAPDYQEAKFSAAAGRYPALTELIEALELHVKPVLTGSC